jgi:hypothetical protein
MEMASPSPRMRQRAGAPVPSHASPNALHPAVFSSTFWYQEILPLVWPSPWLASSLDASIIEPPF